MSHSHMYDFSLFPQNENVERVATSEAVVSDMRRPDRRTPMKVRKAKTDQFRTVIWKAYCEQQGLLTVTPELVEEDQNE